MVGKKLRSLCFMLFIVFVLVGCTKKDDGVVTIGINQFVEVDALDRAREGFKAGLASRGFKEDENVKFVYQSAQAKAETADLISKSFVSDKVDMIFAIATPSAQSAKNATNKKAILPFLSSGSKIPVLFSAVTDPVLSELVESSETPGGNLTGTSDATPMREQFELIKQVFPTKTKVGILFNTGESNSQVQVDQAKALATEFGFTIHEKGITSTNDVATALDSFLNNIDILYIPTDNTVASSMPTVMNKTLAKKIPVIASEEGQVKDGALLTVGIDYYKLGFQTGLMAADILEGKSSPENMPVQILDEMKLVINTDTLDELGITIDAALLNRAELIESGE